MRSVPVFSRKRALSIGLASVACAAAWISPGAFGQACGQPAGSIQVDGSYAPLPGGSPPGGWWLVPNCANTNGNSTYDSQDVYNTSTLPLDSPTLLRVTGTNGPWVYITGASSAYSYGNFPIYRTQDFRTFYLHMLAFDPSNQGASGQSQWSNQIYLNGSKQYFNLKSPQLFLDNSGPVTMVVLNFSAVENNTTTIALHPGVAANDQYRSCFQVRIPWSKFESWHGLSPTGNGPRFADQREGYGSQDAFGYRLNNGVGSMLYDGGNAQGWPIPASGNKAMIGPSCGQLVAQALGGLAVRCRGSQAWMYRDPFTYIYNDYSVFGFPTPHIKMFYSFLNQPSPATTANGIHIAAQELLNPGYQFDAAYTAGSYANNFSNDNPVNGFANGRIGPGGTAWASGSAGMSPCLFYANNRHYLLYCRNSPDSPAYQIVYRMSEPYATVDSMQNSGFFQTASTPEYVLLRPSTTTVNNGANFGDPEVFRLIGTDSPLVPQFFHLIFRVKPANTTATYPFFKELTFDPATDQLLELSDNPNELDPRRNISYFRIPYCRY